MNIILYGPPGSGKGTQGNILVKKFNLLKVSTGDLLRDEIKKKTALGLKISSDIDKGKLISDFKAIKIDLATMKQITHFKTPSPVLGVFKIPKINQYIPNYIIL